MNIFFTSDTHFGHTNILRYDQSPFASIREQDNAIVHLWNAKVSKTDKVFHLGDFAFGKQADIAYVRSIANRLNGRIHLIKGVFLGDYFDPKGLPAYKTNILQETP